MRTRSPATPATARRDRHGRGTRPGTGGVPSCRRSRAARGLPATAPRRRKLVGIRGPACPDSRGSYHRLSYPLAIERQLTHDALEHHKHTIREEEYLVDVTRVEHDRSAVERRFAKTSVNV